MASVLEKTKKTRCRVFLEVMTTSTKHTINSYNPSYSTTPTEFTYNSQWQLIVNSLPNKTEKKKKKRVALAVCWRSSLCRGMLRACASRRRCFLPEGDTHVDDLARKSCFLPEWCFLRRHPNAVLRNMRSITLWWRLFLKLSEEALPSYILIY